MGKRNTRGRNTKGRSTRFERNTKGRNTRRRNTKGRNTRRRNTKGRNTRRRNTKGRNTRRRNTRKRNTLHKINQDGGSVWRAMRRHTQSGNQAAAAAVPNWYVEGNTIRDSRGEHIIRVGDNVFYRGGVHTPFPESHGWHNATLVKIGRSVRDGENTIFLQEPNGGATFQCPRSMVWRVMALGEDEEYYSMFRSLLRDNTARPAVPAPSAGTPPGRATLRRNSARPLREWRDVPDIDTDDDSDY